MRVRVSDPSDIDRFMIDSSSTSLSANVKDWELEFSQKERQRRVPNIVRFFIEISRASVPGKKTPLSYVVIKSP